jgi:hypothetical protein
MMKKRSILSWLLAFCLCFAMAMPALAADVDDVDYLYEIEQLRAEEVDYQLEQYKNMDKLEQAVYLNNLNETAALYVNDLSEDEIEQIIKENIDNAYVYYVTEDGRVFSEDGYVGDLEYDDVPIGFNEEETFAADATTINGQDTGAFIRQLSKPGYMGIYSTYTLPNTTSNTANYINCRNNSVGYIYNIISAGINNGSFDMEGGMQFNTVKLDYSPYVRINGGGLNFTDLTGATPKRYLKNTSVTQNLRYEPANSKIKYYANGTNIDGQKQSVVLGYAQTFTNVQLNGLRAGRVTGLACTNFNGTTNLGTLIVSYTNTQLCKSSSTGSYNMVNLTTSLLDSWTSNNKVYGTSSYPASKCSVSPTSGTITSQKHTIKF